MPIKKKIQKKSSPKQSTAIKRTTAATVVNDSKREHILNCALEVFLENGYTQATMDKVAALASSSKQTIYLYFEDKEGLFHALVADLAGKIFVPDKEIHKTELSTEEYLARTANRFFAQTEGEEYASFFRLVIAESNRFPELAKLYVSSIVQPSAQELATYLASRRDLKLDDPEAVARAFRGSLASYVLVQKILHGDRLAPMSKKRLVKALIALIMKAGAPTRRH